MDKFKTLGISDNIIKALDNMGFEEPTPIQEQAIPALLAGRLLGPYYGLWVGLLAPTVSSLATGMPPLIPVAPVMAVELAAYGAAGGYLYRRRRFGILPSLLAAMTAGRLAAAAAAFALVRLFAVHVDPLAFVTGAVITGLPGITVQLMRVPLLVRRLEAHVGISSKG